MSDSDKDKKDLLGDLENIKHLLNDNEKSSEEDSLEDLFQLPDDASAPSIIDEKVDTSTTSASEQNDQDIPLLSDIVPQDETSSNTEHIQDTENTEYTSDPENNASAPSSSIGNDNPFIPYEAIDRLKKERKSMRNFAAEVMEAAQQGIHKNELDQFDLFKYSKKAPDTTSASSVNEDLTPPKSNKTQLSDDASSVPTCAPETLIPMPNEQQMAELIEQVIEDHRPLLEEALKDALSDFIKKSIQNNTPTDK